MAVMRYTLIDKNGTISFIAPWNTLKALVAGCSRRPAPQDLLNLLEAASKYDSGLKDYVLNGLAVFDEHYTARDADNPGEPTGLNAQLEQELRDLLAKSSDLPERSPAETEAEIFDRPFEEEKPEITYEELLEKQRQLRGVALSRHPVLRVLDDETRRESLEPVKIGLVIFNLPAKRIIQVQNSYGVLKRSDRGRYFEHGQPTDRLYFYRLPSDWSLLP
jgi:hypothetical protein